MFLRAWYSIEPRKLYNPVTSLLLSDKEGWQGMRLTGQIRRDEGLKTPSNADSAYRVSSTTLPLLSNRNSPLLFQPVARTTRRFNTLKIPRNLQAGLPFASKPKVAKPQRNQTYMQSRAVVMEPEETRAVALLQQIQALRKDKGARRDAKKKEQRQQHLEKVAKLESTKMDKRKDDRRDQLRLASIKSKRNADSEGGGRPRKRKRET